jgi:hypothetical protein
MSKRRRCLPKGASSIDSLLGWPVRRRTIFWKQLADKLGLRIKESAMPSEIPQVVRSSACNDNGAAVLAHRRTAPRGVLTAAVRACELVLLDYVARGSMVVMRADRRRIGAAA